MTNVQKLKKIIGTTLYEKGPGLHGSESGVDGERVRNFPIKSVIVANLGAKIEMKNGMSTRRNEEV